MPDLRSGDKVVAIFCSDIHLCHKVPVARSAEPNWYDAMDRTLCQLRALSSKYNAPVICAGDIFDRWNSPAELINFALDSLPTMYAIPGQHDLPHHNYGDIRKSAYWTLVEAGTIVDLKDQTEINGVWYSPFPWGFDPEPIDQEQDVLKVAVVHAYIWAKGYSYPKAPKEKKASNYLEKIAGYDVAVFGDNHKGFLYHQILNCGTLMRRKADEYNYIPSVGLFRENGNVTRHFLNTTEDKFIDIDKALALVEKGMETADFLEELGNLGKHFFDFAEALKQFCDTNHVGKGVRKVLTEIMEDEK